MVVAIDPAEMNNEGSEENRMVVAGAIGQGTDFLLDDISSRYAPHES